MEKDNEPKKRPTRKPAPKKTVAEAAPEPAPVRYVTKTGIVYDGKRVSVGTICSDIPDQSAQWFLAHDYIEKVD